MKENNRADLITTLDKNNFSENIKFENSAFTFRTIFSFSLKVPLKKREREQKLDPLHIFRELLK